MTCEDEGQEGLDVCKKTYSQILAAGEVCLASHTGPRLQNRRPCSSRTCIPRGGGSGYSPPSAAGGCKTAAGGTAVVDYAAVAADAAGPHSNQQQYNHLLR